MHAYACNEQRGNRVHAPRIELPQQKSAQVAGVQERRVSCKATPHLFLVYMHHDVGIPLGCKRGDSRQESGVFTPEILEMKHELSPDVFSNSYITIKYTNKHDVD